MLYTRITRLGCTTVQQLRGWQQVEGLARGFQTHADSAPQQEAPQKAPLATAQQPELDSRQPAPVAEEEWLEVVDRETGAAYMQLKQ